MPFNVIHTVRFEEPSWLDKLAALLKPDVSALEKKMSIISGLLDQLEARVKHVEDNNAADADAVKAMQAQIADLQAKVEAGTVTDSERARLADLIARIGNVTDVVPGVPAEAPPETPPATEATEG